jgi:hypothetical protein
MSHFFALIKAVIFVGILFLICAFSFTPTFSGIQLGRKKCLGGTTFISLLEIVLYTENGESTFIWAHRKASHHI